MNPSAWKFVNETKDTIRKVRKIGRDVILKRRKEIADGKEVEKDLLSFIVKAAGMSVSIQTRTTYISLQEGRYGHTAC